MQIDFRVLVDFPDNRKTKRLVALLGEGGIRQLLRLWSFARVKRPKGTLLQLDKAAIGETASGRTIGHDITKEEAEAITDAFEQAGFLDLTRNGSYRLHDWHEINPYSFYAEERKKRAQKAAKAKWAKRDKDLGVCSEQQLALLPDESCNAPTPTPSPTPSPITGPLPVGTGAITQPNVRTAVRKIKETAESKSDFQRVKLHWMESYARVAKERSWRTEKYLFAGSTDGEHIKRILSSEKNADKVIEVVDAMFASDDEFINTKGGFTLGVFRSQFNRLAQNIGSNGNGPRRQTVFEKFYADFIAQNGSEPVTRKGFLDYCRRMTDEPALLSEIERDIDQLLTVGTRA